MGIFKSILRLFQGEKTQSVPNTPDTNSSQHFIDRWEKERQARVASYEQELKLWLLQLLKEKKELRFNWESGNDEAFVTFEDEDNMNENFESLQDYMIAALDIPDAGEFEMHGTGTIYIAGNAVRVTHESITKMIIDYDETTDEVIYGNNETDKGDIILFTI